MVLGNEQVLAEYEDSGALDAFQPSRKFVYGAYVDEPLLLSCSELAGGGRTETAYYYHQDRNFNVIALTDDTGQVADRYSYSAYGEIETLTNGGTKITANPYFFTGRRFDAELTIYYYRARYHDPALGRFLSRDPLGYVDGMSLYEYVQGMPLLYSDWNGLIRYDESQPYQIKLHGTLPRVENEIRRHYGKKIKNPSEWKYKSKEHKCPMSPSFLQYGKGWKLIKGPKNAKESEPIRDESLKINYGEWENVFEAAKRGGFVWFPVGTREYQATGYYRDGLQFTKRQGVATATEYVMHAITGRRKGNVDITETVRYYGECTYEKCDEEENVLRRIESTEIVNVKTRVGKIEISEVRYQTFRKYVSHDFKD